MNILIAIITLSILILVHELGHLFAAKANGIKVLEFSIFMGPKLFAVKKGETQFTIRAIPIGGYVKMEGEEETSGDKRAYCNKSAAARASVLAAGPLMNILVAILILIIFFSASGFTTLRIASVEPNTPLYEAGVREGDKLIKFNNKRVFHPMDLDVLSYPLEGENVPLVFKRKNVDGGIEKIRTEISASKDNKIYILGFTATEANGEYLPIVSQFSPISPIKEAGIEIGDKIVKLNDVDVRLLNEVKAYLYNNGNNPINITVERNNKTIMIDSVVPYEQIVPMSYNLDMDFEYVDKDKNIIQTIGSASSYSITTMRSVLYSIVWLINGQASIKDVSGPVGIVNYIGDAVEVGKTFMDKLFNLMGFAAFLSLNLGVFNLIPFPALDGSKLLLILVEKIRRKPIDPEKEALVSFVGLAFLMGLMVFTVINDVVKIFNN